MWTHITLATLAAAVSAWSEDEMMTQAMCDAYLWGLESMGWTCYQNWDIPTEWECEIDDPTLFSGLVDSTSAAWEMSCTTPDG